MPIPTGGLSIDLNKAASKIADYLGNRLELREDEREVATYGFILLLNGVAGIISIILMAWPLGVLPEALAAAVSSAILKVFSGGVHSSSPVRCALISGIIFSILGFTAQQFNSLSFAVAPALAFLCLAGAVVILLYAPVDTPQKPINRPEERRSFKRKSLVVLVLYALLAFTGWGFGFPGPAILGGSALGMGWQVFSLTPPGFYFMEKVDRLLSRVVR